MIAASTLSDEGFSSSNLLLVDFFYLLGDFLLLAMEALQHLVKERRRVDLLSWGTDPTTGTGVGELGLVKVAPVGDLRRLREQGLLFLAFGFDSVSQRLPEHAIQLRRLFGFLLGIDGSLPLGELLHIEETCLGVNAGIVDSLGLALPTL